MVEGVVEKGHLKAHRRVGAARVEVTGKGEWGWGEEVVMWLQGEVISRGLVATLRLQWGHVQS